MNYPIKAFDVYAGTLNVPQLQAMVKSGYGAVFHYYSHSPSKTLTKESAQNATKAGLLTGTVWEASGDNPSNFTVDYGLGDGAKALEEATACGQPLGSCIYFAVDFGPTTDQLTKNIIPYFNGVRHNMDGKYKVGVYGAGATLEALETAKLAEYFWLGGAMGWAGSRTYLASGKAHVVQGLPTTVNGMSIDPDTILKEAGLFTVP